MKGILVFCHRFKDKQSTSEIRRILTEFNDQEDIVDDSKDFDNIEDEFKKELAMINDQEKRLFYWEKIGIDCMYFIRVVDKIEPISLVSRILKSIHTEKVVRTRFTSRIVPISDTCFANESDITALCHKLVLPYFNSSELGPWKFAIIPKSRNNTVMSREKIIEIVAKVMPTDKSHVVDLKNPQLCIIVEVFKSICGISVVEDFYELKKFNVEVL